MATSLIPQPVLHARVLTLTLSVRFITHGSAFQRQTRLTRWSPLSRFAVARIASCVKKARSSDNDRASLLRIQDVRSCHTSGGLGSRPARLRGRREDGPQRHCPIATSDSAGVQPAAASANTRPDLSRALPKGSGTRPPARLRSRLAHRSGGLYNS